ncbi:hypothetical protein AA101099_3033 [Neoasaia chiangmaiensis NBRC 101099]|uniref:Glycosyltransferase n=1 Tax=Neoasaia chiangmaiensis TaxID=320497 RepID=A0A1U9KNU7_9PROT|nr:glycosyltransferase [Neoasaia chiangmaiensis]AQS87380.1 glycosyltransferase [Neoasaia chiangmaiensis]GBR42922.1 hypothetical protein AA101099_3033 [Neoasaia chiangmaiensis NBRC 101099]GEN16145.1 hypothetical protein NCH01_25760 [Neoasaia chiangmaiensis]
MQPGLFSFGSPVGQAPYDVGVVMPSLLRPSLFQALSSVFRQDVAGRVQVLIGVDQFPDDNSGLRMIEAACRHCPAGWSVQLLWPGYSTSVRHGGVTAARDGGALRNILSLMANAPRIAYLDDDNWWRADHLSGLLSAIEGHDWAWSRRWFVHPRSLRPVCVDQWESVGPDAGIFAERQGGFVDPNCLMIDRQRAVDVLTCWNTPLSGDLTGMTADRHVFQALRTRPGRCSALDSAYYVVRESDSMHPFRQRMMGALWAVADGWRG